MSDPTIESPSADLQFDRAIAVGAPETSPDAAVICSKCTRPIPTAYYSVADAVMCGACKHTFERAVAETRSAGAMGRAVVFGLGAAVAGAVLYYAVIAIANLEIGIIAILTGFMVGYAVRKGARGGGGRRFQLLAAGLTYFSVGLAYTPLVFKERAEVASVSATQLRDSTSSADSSSTDRAFEAPREAKGGSLLLGLGALFLLAFALPLTVVVGSLPSGLISGLIIGIGIRQAWTMTSGERLAVTGPFQVGTVPPVAS